MDNTQQKGIIALVKKTQVGVKKLIFSWYILKKKKIEKDDRSYVKTWEAEVGGQ